MKASVSLCALAIGALVIVGCGGRGSNAPTASGPSGTIMLYANGSTTPVSSSTSSPYTLTLAQTVVVKVAEVGYSGTFYAAATAGAPCFGASGSGDTFIVSGDEQASCKPGAGAISFTDSLGHSATLYLNAL